jgi:hypothetical protein
MRMTTAKTIVHGREVEEGELDAASHATTMWLADTTRRRIAVLLCLLAYLALGFVANLPVWLHGPSTVTICGGCGDNGQEVWFLASTAHAVAHGTDPLLTNWINFPWGANLMDNTTMPLAGFVGTPITLLFGPVVAYSVLFTAAFAGSAAAAFFALRRYVSWTPAAFAGGLLYGFSPYMVGEGLGHLFLLLAPLPPLILLCFDDIMVRQRHRWWVAGGALGLLSACQMLVSTELLAIFVLMAIIGIAVLALARRDLVGSHWRHVGAALAVALVVFAAISAFPLYIMEFGPAHVTGPIHPVKVLAGLSTDLAGILAPDGNQRFSFGFAATTTAWVHFASGKGVPIPDLGENGGYVGLPLLAFLVAGTYRFRRDRLVRFASLMALLALVFSMGATLNVAGHSLGIPLPFRLLTKIPLLQDEVPSRYSVAMWLFIALLTGAVVDRAWSRWKVLRQQKVSESLPKHRRRNTGLAAMIAGAWAILIVLSLVPSWPYPWASDAVPSWFTSPAVGEVPYGTTLVTYPMARSPFTFPDLWQAVAGMRYRVPAGQGVFAHPGRSATETVFDDCLDNGQAPPLTPKLLNKMRKDLRNFAVSTVVVAASVPFAACGTSVMEIVLGEKPVRQFGASVWTGVPSLLDSKTGQAGSPVSNGS